MKARLRLFFIMLITIVLLTACAETSENKSIPVLQSNNRNLLNTFLNEGKKINELYYEEVPVISYYSGGIKIENISKVWLKEDVLKTELVSLFYKDNELMQRETSGELYNYATLARTRYYVGPYPERMKSYLTDKDFDFFIPREKTILWYLDKIQPEINTVVEGKYEDTACLITEILMNNSGSTKLWICTETGLPIRILSSYNGVASERAYCNFKAGKNTVSDTEVKIPPGAIIY